jgi:hypothetical protein
VTLAKSGRSRCGDVNVVVEHHWNAKAPRQQTFNPWCQ